MFILTSLCYKIPLILKDCSTISNDELVIKKEEHVDLEEELFQVDSRILNNSGTFHFCGRPYYKVFITEQHPLFRSYAINH